MNDGNRGPIKDFYVIVFYSREEFHVENKYVRWYRVTLSATSRRFKEIGLASIDWNWNERGSNTRHNEGAGTNRKVIKSLGLIL